MDLGLVEIVLAVIIGGMLAVGLMALALLVIYLARDR